MNETLNKTKHTPGPWKAEGRGGEAYGSNAQLRPCFMGYIKSKAGQTIVQLGTLLGVQGGSSTESEANAKLIAAAPDLLHELRQLIDKCLLLGYYKGMDQQLFNAEQAIKKATL